MTLIDAMIFIVIVLMAAAMGSVLVVLPVAAAIGAIIRHYVRSRE